MSVSNTIINMSVSNTEIVEKFKSFFKLKGSPIAFFYTDDPPKDIYKPKRKSLKNIPCIIQLLNGVRSGYTLVLGKQSRNLCPGGLAYLGFRKIMKGFEYYLSTGMQSPHDSNAALEGERFKKTPELTANFYEKVPFKPNPKKFAVFMPLNQVSQNEYKPLIVIFFVNMDQLAGLIQLANFDVNDNTVIGKASACSTVITEPIAELERDGKPRAVIGLLTDILSRRHVKPDEATFTVGYTRLKEIFSNIDESFLKLEAWKNIYKRIK